MTRLAIDGSVLLLFVLVLGIFYRVVTEKPFPEQQCKAMQGELRYGVCYVDMKSFPKH